MTDSNARMLRPSRPMMRPFISSPGRCRTETTDSLVCSVATRWMARVTILRARFSPSDLASCSMVPDDERRFALGLVLDRADELRLGRLRRQPGHALEFPGAVDVGAVQFGGAPF